MKRTRRTRGGRAWRWSALVLTLALVAPAAAAAQSERYVYVSNQGAANNISALQINANGTLTPVSGSPFSSGGTLTEGLAMTPDADDLYVANFTTNNVSAFNVTATGGLSAVSGSPFGTGFATPLGVAPDPDGGHLFAWNHGSAIAVSTIAGSGALTNITGSPFSVPVNQSNPFAGSVAPDGDHLYVPNENAVAATKTLTAYSVAANGAVANIQTVDTGGINPFGSTITPDGAHVYVSNPDVGNNVGNVGGFNVDPTTGLLTPAPGTPYTVGTGSHPLNMAVSPDGDHLYVATRQTDTVNGYNIAADGSLSFIPGSPFATGGDNGKGIALTPDGDRLYVSNNISNNISGFNVAANGALTLIPGSPFATGSTGSPDLESIAITPNQPPTAAFSPTTLAPAGQASSFNAGTSTDSDGTVARYDWNFGDGGTLADGGPTPQHTYAQPGTYTVALTVTDNENCSTERIFTGKATLCNGSSVATISQQVTIAAAPAAAQCVVPDVVKKKKKKAKQAIADANCTVGKVKKKHSSKVKKGKVIKQKPPAGTVLAAGSAVKIKVSSGPG